MKRWLAGDLLLFRKRAGARLISQMGWPGKLFLSEILKCCRDVLTAYRSKPILQEQSRRCHRLTG